MLTTTSSNRSVTDRRRQPQNSIRAIRAALAHIHWRIYEETSHKFVADDTHHTNESFGYALKIPRAVPLKELWLGYISHRKLKPGIYVQLTPQINPRDKKWLAPLKHGYRMTDFGKYVFYKQLLPLQKVKRMENKFGLIELKKQYQTLLLEIYPFNERIK